MGWNVGGWRGRGDGRGDGRGGEDGEGVGEKVRLVYWLVGFNG